LIVVFDFRFDLDKSGPKRYYFPATALAPDDGGNVGAAAASVD
jgi:hypothetical protein